MNFLKNSNPMPRLWITGKQTIFFVLLVSLISFPCSHAMETVLGKRGREEQDQTGPLASTPEAKRATSEIYHALGPILNGHFPQAPTLTAFLQQLSQGFDEEALVDALMNSEILSRVDNNPCTIPDFSKILRQIYLDAVKINCLQVLQCFNEIMVSDKNSLAEALYFDIIMLFLFCDYFKESKTKKIQFKYQHVEETFATNVNNVKQYSSQSCQDASLFPANINFIVQLMQAELESGNHQRFPQMYHFLQHNRQHIDAAILAQITHPLILFAINVIDKDENHKIIVERILQTNATELNLSRLNINDVDSSC